MMIGPKVRYCVTYKTGEPTFNIFRANYIHNFKVTVDNKNLEGSYGLEIESLGQFLCTRLDGVYVYDSNTYQECGKLEVTLLAPDKGQRELNQVLAIQKCQNE